jgi:hypothetical protein
MDWSDLKSVVGKAAPILGTLVGGPAGATIGGLIASALGTDNTPDAVSQALAVNPDAAVKLRQIESDERVKLQSMALAHADNEIAAQSQVVQSVNQTMQTEAKADHWPTYTWRPFIGFAFGAYIVSLFALPIFGQRPVMLSPDITLAIGGILGVASWFRGKMQADPNVQSDNRG